MHLGDRWSVVIVVLVQLQEQLLASARLLRRAPHLHVACPQLTGEPRVAGAEDSEAPVLVGGQEHASVLAVAIAPLVPAVGGVEQRSGGDTEAVAVPQLDLQSGGHVIAVASEHQLLIGVEPQLAPVDPQITGQRHFPARRRAQRRCVGGCARKAHAGVGAHRLVDGDPAGAVELELGQQHGRGLAPRTHRWAAPLAAAVVPASG